MSALSNIKKWFSSGKPDTIVTTHKQLEGIKQATKTAAEAKFEFDRQNAMIEMAKMQADMANMQAQMQQQVFDATLTPSNQQAQANGWKASYAMKTLSPSYYNDPYGGLASTTQALSKAVNSNLNQMVDAMMKEMYPPVNVENKPLEKKKTGNVKALERMLKL